MSYHLIKLGRFRKTAAAILVSCLHIHDGSRVINRNSYCFFMCVWIYKGFWCVLTRTQHVYVISYLLLSPRNSLYYEDCFKLDKRDYANEIHGYIASIYNILKKLLQLLVQNIYLPIYVNVVGVYECVPYTCFDVRVVFAKYTHV